MRSILSWFTRMNRPQVHSEAANYRVILIESEEGYAVSCPALKGCHSQGATREEALENIKDAIREWLAAGLIPEEFRKPL